MEVGLLTGLLLSSCDLELSSKGTSSTSLDGTMQPFSGTMRDLPRIGGQRTALLLEEVDLTRQPQHVLQSNASAAQREGALTMGPEKNEQSLHQSVPDRCSCGACKGGAPIGGCKRKPKSGLGSQGGVMFDSIADGSVRPPAASSQQLWSWWLPSSALWKQLHDGSLSAQPRKCAEEMEGPCRCWTSLSGAPGDPNGLLPTPETRRQVGIRWPQGPCYVWVRGNLE